ncbi:MAG: hypothetical protein ACLT4C_03190 [Butyricicoccus sp.]
MTAAAGKRCERGLERQLRRNAQTVKRVLPVFRGAVVLCDGADDASVRLSVTQAVSTVCGIGADKVTVLKMQSDT